MDWKTLKKKHVNQKTTASDGKTWVWMARNVSKGIATSQPLKIMKTQVNVRIFLRI